MQQQNNPNWFAYVGYDSCKPKPPVLEERIKYFFLGKVGGYRNYGGKARNALISMVETEWVCFLDDDDSFRQNYMDTFLHELEEYPNADCIVFRMSYDKNDRKVLPPLNATKPEVNKVGISFAVKKQFLKDHSIQFKNDKLEDYLFLKSIENVGGKIHFSKTITYNVRF